MGYHNKKTKQRIQFRGLAPYVRAWPLTFPQVSGVERTIVRKSIFKEPLLTPSGSFFLFFFTIQEALVGLHLKV